MTLEEYTNTLWAFEPFIVAISVFDVQKRRIFIPALEVKLYRNKAEEDPIWSYIREKQVKYATVERKDGLLHIVIDGSLRVDIRS